MYYNRIIVIYFLFVTICFNINVSARVINNKCHNVCTAVLKPRNFQKKVDLPLIKNGKLDLDLIKLKDCSISKEVKTKLKKIDIENLLQTKDIRAIEEKVIKKIIAKYIKDLVNRLYNENYYFYSGVGSYEFLDSGELVIQCIENPIPRENFRLFIKDDKSPLKLNLKEQEIIFSTKLPTGNYRQINNDNLTKQIFGDKKNILKIDFNKFTVLSKLEIYKNLFFCASKNNGEFYFDFFFDDYYPFVRFNWKVVLQAPNPTINFQFDNINFLNTMAGLNITADFNLFNLLDGNNKFKLGLISDTGSYEFFKNKLSNISFSKIDLVTSKNDVFELFSRLIKKINKNIENKIPVQKLTSNSKDSLESNKEKGHSGVGKSIKEAITNTLLKTNDNKNNLDECSLNDSKIEYMFCKRFQKLGYGFSSNFGIKSLSVTNKFEYRTLNERFICPLFIGCSWMNTLKYKKFTDKGSTDSVKDPNFTYGVVLYAMGTVKSRFILDSKICLTNDKIPNEYRSIDKNNIKKCFYSSNSILIPLLNKPNFQPLIGPFFDILVPLENGNPDTCDFSLGLEFLIWKFKFSIPLLTKTNSTYIWNDFSKDSKKFYIS